VPAVIDQRPVPPEAIAKLIARMKVPDNGTFWEELAFMEAEGFDLAWQQPIIHGQLYPHGEDLGFPQKLGIEQEKAIVLEIRERIRSERGLPPLSDEEKEKWDYRRIQWKPDSECQKSGDDATPEEIDRLVAAVDARAPYLRGYLRSVRAHNKPLGVNGGPNDRLIIRSNWISFLVTDVAVDLFRPACPKNITLLWWFVADRMTGGEAA
jgi:hypothetical protein